VQKRQHIHFQPFLLALVGMFGWPIALCWAPQSIFGQDIPKSVNYHLADIQSLARIESLMQAKSFKIAATAIAAALEGESLQVCPFPHDELSAQRIHTAPNVRRFTLSLVGNWFEKFPEAHGAYQEIVDATASIRFEESKTSLESLEQFVDRFAFSSSGEKALLLLGDYYYQRGHYYSAKAAWQRVLAKPGLPAHENNREIQPVNPDSPLRISDNPDLYFGNWRFPNPKTGQAQIHARLLLVSMLSNHDDNFQDRLDSFEKNWPDAKFQANGKSTSWRDWLASEYQNHRSTLIAKLSDQGDELSLLDIQMQRIWKLPTDSIWPVFPDRYSQICLPAGRSGNLEYRIFPEVNDGQIIWQNGALVRSLHLENGTATIPVSNARIANESTTGTLWRLPREADFHYNHLSESDSVTGIAQFSVTINDKNVFARMGNPLIASQAKGTRNKSAIVGLDLRRQGRLLPGFPLEPPSEEFEFIGAPLIDDTGLYVALQKRAGTQVEMHVAFYDSRIVAAAGPPVPKWSTFIASAATHGQSLAGSMSRNVLQMAEGSIIFGGTLGTVASLKKSDGRIQWLVSYPRQELESRDPEFQMLNYFRATKPCVFADRIFVLPEDHSDVFCIELMTGRVLWHQPLPDVVYMLGAHENHLLVSGDRLYWLDRDTGQIDSSYPGYTGPVAIGEARCNPRGIGKGAICGDLVAFPVAGEIILFDVSLVTEPGGMNSPRIRRRIKVDNGNENISSLYFESGILVLIKNGQIEAYR
jgi:outer membrane protein assembly factor BamB